VVNHIAMQTGASHGDKITGWADTLRTMQFGEWMGLLRVVFSRMHALLECVERMNRSLAIVLRSLAPPPLEEENAAGSHPKPPGPLLGSRPETGRTAGLNQTGAAVAGSAAVMVPATPDIVATVAELVVDVSAGLTDRDMDGLTIHD